MEHTVKHSETDIERLRAVISPDGVAALSSHFAGCVIHIPESGVSSLPIYDCLSAADAKALRYEFPGDRVYFPTHHLRKDFLIEAATLWMAGMGPKDIGTRCHVTTAWVMQCLANFAKLYPRVAAFKSARLTKIIDLADHPKFNHLRGWARCREHRKSLLPRFQREVAAYYPAISQKSNAVLAVSNAGPASSGTPTAKPTNTPSSRPRLTRRELQKA
jgi:hypothetical protein